MADRAVHLAKAYCKEKKFPKTEWIKPYLSYIEGYKQAKKDFMEKAVEWLKEHYDCYDYFNEDKQEYIFNVERLCEDFKKYMSE